MALCAAIHPTVENYLHEAGLVGNAPSGTIYTDSQGHTVTNLGVHEHWCNSTEKLYSRNLGKSEGIELIQMYGRVSSLAPSFPSSSYRIP